MSSGAIDPEADGECESCHGDGRCRQCLGRAGRACDHCGEVEVHCSTCDCTGMCPECVLPKYRSES